jgi:hypothetical protein
MYAHALTAVRLVWGSKMDGRTIHRLVSSFGIVVDELEGSRRYATPTQAAAELRTPLHKQTKMATTILQVRG